MDRINGGGSVNTTHLVAYQERGSDHSVNNVHLPVPRKKVRKLFNEDIAVKIKPVNNKAEPSKLNQPVSEIQEVGLNHGMKFVLWLYTRKCNSFNQTVAIFKGWALKRKPENPIKKTIETYLAPITSKVTDFEQSRNT